MTRVIAIVGPTAAGKSSLAVRLAQEIGGELVNADSMQLYRGMDIGTAKLSAEECEGVPHHLLDIWDVTETASVAAYQRLARACFDDLLARGVTPILVGGSGLYVRAAVDELVFPGTDPALRHSLERELAAVGPAPLHARLVSRDPRAAAAILPTNGRRIVRALEVVELRGSFAARLPEPRHVYDVAGLFVDAGDLDARIEHRVDLMFRRGLVAEVEGLVAAGLRHGRTASRALGYQQVLQYLDGALTEEEARVATKLATRRFARRQRSWFRREQWLHRVVDPAHSEVLAWARIVDPRR